MTIHNPDLQGLIASNAQWAADVESELPSFFKDCAKGQAPKILWIGCADSRVPESVIVACKPGEIFVHRNIANQFHLDDDSAQSVLAYAVDVLGVEHVVVVGHTQCGGVAGAYDVACAKSAVNGNSNGKPTEASTPLTRWLGPLVALASQPSFAPATRLRADALLSLVEANVRMQVENVTQSDVIRSAWAAWRAQESSGQNGNAGANMNGNGHTEGRRKKVYVHGWVYALENGRLRDLDVSEGPEGKVDM